MIDGHKQQKIQKFLSDTDMREAVREGITKSLLKKRNRSDVHLTAASMIAIDLIDEAWKDLETYKKKEVREKRTIDQVGI